MGRKKNSKYLTFEAARQYVRDHGLTSVVQYFRWHDRYDIQKVPKYPYRVYIEEWIDWSDFLGAKRNIFRGKYHKGGIRSWEEHLQYARESNIKTMDEWLITEHPDGISKRPDTRFKQFSGWHYFLGTGKKKAANLVEVQQKIEDNVVEVLLFVQGDIVEQTVRVYTIRGINAAKQWIQENRVPLIKGFKLDKGYDWKGYLQQWGEFYGNNEWRIPNLNECLFNLDLEWL